MIYFLVWCMVLNTSLPAVLATPTPVGGGFTEGTGTITQDGNATNVVVNQVRSVIEWSSLDTVGGALEVRESLNFSQGELTNSAVLNRVMSGYGTQFFGDLNAEGMRIFIVNPAGIVFGEGSTVNVTQLIASNLDISNDNFLSGDYEFAGDIEDVDVYERLGVINNGTITTTPGAEGVTEGVVLIGQKILNTGTIITGTGGFIVMAAGDRVLLGEPGSKIVVEMDSVTLSENGFGNVVNEGGITASGGTVVLAAGDIFSVPLHPQLKVNSGTVDEPVYEVADQPVRVESGIGTVTQSGFINTDGIDGDGGSVVLTAGDNVILVDGSLTTANGGISNAGANGGEVIAYASDMFNYDAIVDFQDGAIIEVRGGNPSDPSVLEPADTEEKFDGGLAEISGDHLFFDGAVDATSQSFDIPDPENAEETITITPEGGTLHIDPVSLILADGGIPDDGAARDTFYEEELEAYSQAGVNTILDADFAITVEHMSTDGVIEGGSGDIALRTIYDTGSIEFLPDPDTGLIETEIQTIAGFEQGGGSIYMLAGSGGIITGDLSTGVRSNDKVSEPGHIRLLTTNGGDIETGSMLVEGGSYVEISAVSAGNLTVNGSVVSKTNQVPSNTQGIFSANLCLVAMKNVYVYGSEIAVEAHGKGETNADITICAGEDVIIENIDSITSYAITSENEPGNIATATVTIVAGGNKEGTGTVSINGVIYDSAPEADNSGLPITVTSSTSGSGAPIVVTPGDDSWDKTNVEETAHSVLLIDNDAQVPPGDPGSPCYGNCPEPPLLPPVPTILIILDDTATIGKSVTKHYIAVLINDDNGEELVGGNVLGDFQYDGDGILTPILDENDEIIGFEYTPPSDAEFVWDGSSDYAEYTETFTYEAEDAEGNVSVNTAIVTIHVINFLPVAQPDSYEVDYSTPLSPAVDQGIIVGVVPAINGDYDLDPEDSLTAILVGDGSTSHGGTVTLNPDGSFSYTPSAGFSGTDSFTYYVTDGYNNSESARVTISVGSSPVVLAVPYIPPAPGIEREVIEVSGCPALVKWVASELGTDESKIQVWMANALASARDIQSCDACADLKEAATILQDVDGARVAALAEMINEFASSTAPPTEEQMASIADAIANDIEGNIQYAAAGEYLDALAKYVGILNSEMGFSADESIQFATNNYVVTLVEGENMGVAAYVASTLAALGGS